MPYYRVSVSSIDLYVQYAKTFNDNSWNIKYITFITYRFGSCGLRSFRLCSEDRFQPTFKIFHSNFCCLLYYTSYFRRTCWSETIDGFDAKHGQPWTPTVTNKIYYFWAYTKFIARWLEAKRLRSFRGSVLAFSTQVRGFKPGRNRRIFRAKKSSARLPSEGK